MVIAMSSLHTLPPGTETLIESFTSVLAYSIRASVHALCRDGPSEISHDPRTKQFQNTAETARMALETPEVHMYLYIGPKGPYVP